MVKCKVAISAGYIFGYYQNSNMALLSIMDSRID